MSETATTRKCAVETAQCWFDEAHVANLKADPRAVLYMENAFNHTENALYATRAALERLAQTNATLVEALKFVASDPCYIKLGGITHEIVEAEIAKAAKSSV